MEDGYRSSFLCTGNIILIAALLGHNIRRDAAPAAKRQGRRIAKRLSEKVNSTINNDGKCDFVHNGKCQKKKKKIQRIFNKIICLCMRSAASLPHEVEFMVVNMSVYV